VGARQNVQFRSERGKLTMRTEGGGGAVLRASRAECEVLREALQTSKECHRPFALTACDILRQVGIQIEAAALVKAGRRATKSALLVSRKGRRHTIVTKGLMSLAVGFAARCPVLVSEELVRKHPSESGSPERCEVCGKEATIHITEIHEGKPRVRHLCQEHEDLSLL